jgi:hypothetical protein
VPQADVLQSEKGPHERDPAAGSQRIFLHQIWSAFADRTLGRSFFFKSDKKRIKIDIPRSFVSANWRCPHVRTHQSCPYLCFLALPFFPLAASVVLYVCSELLFLHFIFQDLKSILFPLRNNSIQVVPIANPCLRVARPIASTKKLLRTKIKSGRWVLRYHLEESSY